MDTNLQNKVWWSYLEHDLQELLLEAALLLMRVDNWKEKFHDYSFIVFPAAKAYEGFLKKLFLDLGFIDMDEYSGKRFRIGKALNPSLDRNRYKNESVYDKLVDFCKGEELAKKLWDAWKQGRNLLFHWFPNERNAIDYQEAKDRFYMIVDAIDEAFVSCKLEKVGDNEK